MLEFMKIILAKNIWSVVASWSILVQIFLAIKWHQYLLFHLHICPFFTYQPHHTSTTPVSTPIHIAVLPLPAPDQLRQPEKRRRV